MSLSLSSSSSSSFFRFSCFPSSSSSLPVLHNLIFLHECLRAVLPRLVKIFRLQRRHSLAAYFVLLFVDIVNASTLMAESIEECCRTARVPDVCTRTLCNPSQSPSDFAVYDVFEQRHGCSRHLNQIAKCLAAGRDHYPCCSTEAKDLEESACFGLCRGEGEFKSWSSFQTCLAINIPTMFSCFQRGYRTSPSPPTHLSVQYIGATEVDLSWKQPEFNAHLVDHYLINLYEIDPNTVKIDPETEIRMATISKSARISVLEPGTQYIAKVIAVTAPIPYNDNGIDNENDESGTRSLPSEARFKTDGMPPRINPFKERVHAPIGANVLIACTMIIGGSSRFQRPQIHWEHKSEESPGLHFRKTEESERFNTSYYDFSRFRPKKLIATLKIKNVRPSDFGQWKCKVSTPFGQSESVVHLVKGSVKLPNPAPPDTPLECCQNLGVQHRCLSMCGSMEIETRRYVPRPFMNQDCSSEISKILSCAMPQVDESECCIEKQLPSQCFYLCDSKESPSNLLPHACLKHIGHVEQCRLSGIQRRPSNVRNLKAHRPDSSASPSLSSSASLLLRWESADRADIYFIYWRSKGDQNWSNKSTSSTLLRLNAPGAEEVVVVASNAYGLGPAARLKLQ